MLETLLGLHSHHPHSHSMDATGRHAQTTNAASPDVSDRRTVVRRAGTKRQVGGWHATCSGSGRPHNVSRGGIGMHDLDRAMFETGEIGQQSGPPEYREQQEFLEVLGGLLQQPGGQGEAYESYELDGRELADRTAHEAALAGELLEAHDAGELDRFLGKLLSQAGSAAMNFARSDTGRALGGILKKAARQALPVIGRGIGKAVGPQYA